MKQWIIIFSAVFSAIVAAIATTAIIKARADSWTREAAVLQNELVDIAGRQPWDEPTASAFLIRLQESARLLKRRPLGADPSAMQTTFDYGRKLLSEWRVRNGYGPIDDDHFRF